eukprot:CAMPEP_0114491078 /NCGR_PEP_ID=MMETSP0109-20121206/2801_1 /TAXON_ID=29199 /ORGANISM="Chlorarachnion reptans, Strain CCCM449" /LENGTH=127 /DNA_ID=CAMNT_0001667773 /DNA_START=91 /DNA_END=474 /DNA_ORIENTATION=+
MAKIETKMEDLEPVIDRCSQLMQGGDYSGALRHAIEHPISSKDAKVKEAAAKNICAAMAGVGAIVKFIENAEETEHDTLMKYTFKGMDIYRNENKGKNCAKFLKWHDELVKKCGLGVIMRAMVDKKC